MQMKFFNRIALTVTTVGLALYCTGASINGKVLETGARPTNADILFFGCLAALSVSKLISKPKQRKTT
jgi:hypothetical protein